MTPGLKATIPEQTIYISQLTYELLLQEHFLTDFQLIKYFQIQTRESVHPIVS